MTPPLVSFDPNSALRPGRFDPLALIAVGVARSAAPAMMVIGIIYFTLTVGNHFESLPAIASPMQAFRALVSPLAIAPRSGCCCASGWGSPHFCWPTR